MEMFASKKFVVKKEESLFDQPVNNSQTMMAQEKRAEQLHKNLQVEENQEKRKMIEKEIFEIEKYCQTVNILLCGGV
jgi:hypothetical protein